VAALTPSPPSSDDAGIVTAITSSASATADAVVADAYDALMHHIAAEGCRGYDPYDAMNTRYGILRATKGIRLALTYFNKFSPVNLRPVLGIPKTLDNHGVALILRAVGLHRPSGEAAISLPMLSDHLVSRSLVEKYGYHCWFGLTSPVQTRTLYMSTDVPGVIGTEACASALFELWLDTRDERLREIVLSARAFFLDVLLARYEGAVFFRYKTTLPAYTCTYNASVVAAKYVLRVGEAFGLQDHRLLLREVYGFLASRQRPDGSWNYSVDLRTGREKPQIDFHQGFMLDGFLDYIELGLAGPEIVEAYRRGLAFYRQKQFTPAGRGLYRYPRGWPANIHNQAQGILTFARAGVTDPEARDFARTIAMWTIDHMRSRSGAFHYLRYPMFSNRVEYMRWSNAAMAHALATYLRLGLSQPQRG